MGTRATGRREDPQATPPRRGRPPRLSRDAILQAALRILERSPGEPLTTASIAARVDAAPAALYRHFPSLDDLLDGVLARVLAATEIQVRARASWPAQLRDWTTSLRRSLLRYPSVLGLIGRRGRTSPAWLDTVATTIPILESAGLRGAELARTHLWLAETTVALIMQEASLSLPDQMRGARAALGEMAPERRALLAPVLSDLSATSGDQMFEFAVERMITAIVALTQSSARAPRDGPPGRSRKPRAARAR